MEPVMNQALNAPGTHAPVQDFTDCHAGIIRKLDLLGELPMLLEPAARAREIAVTALEFFREVIFEHHLDEERDLFPAVLASAQEGDESDRVAALASQLTHEHRELESAWKRLEPGLKKIAKGQFSRIELGEVERLVRQYRNHAQFEEREFLPLAQQILGRDSNHMAALGLSLHMRHRPLKPATYI